MSFNGISCTMQNLHMLSNAKTRSISAENYTGQKGMGAMADFDTIPNHPTPKKEKHPARDLGKGWKLSPCVMVKPSATFEICTIDGPGAIQQIWMTPNKPWRYAILRVYWDHEEYPSIECPIGDFFACGLEEYAPINSLAVCVNPGSAFNCYWTMPFKKHCRMTIENISHTDLYLYYQINYVLNDIPDDSAYFHAQFRRVNPLPYKEAYTIVDEIEGNGHYVGTYMTWGVNNNGWWGEGEIKFYMDDDKEYPTICGTGLEDYFCGSYNFENPKTGQYQEFSTPYTGMPQVIRPDGIYKANTRFGLYRWHITDPIRFEKNLKVTIQGLGWRDNGRFLPLQDDISSVAFWYQKLKTKKFPNLPSKDCLEIM